MLTVLLGLLALTGCDWANTPQDDVLDSAAPDDGDTGVEVSVGCPAGLALADSAYLQLSQFLVDGVTVEAEWDSTSVWQGHPAACVDAAGTEVQYVLTVEGAPHGLLTVFAAQTGTFDLSSEGSVRVQLDAAVLDQAVDENTWESSSILAVDNVGASFDWSVSNVSSTGAGGAVVSLEGNGSASPSL